MSSIDLTRTWDVVIVGTGIGGGTLARRLAETGISVLMLERGTAGHAGEQHGLSRLITDVGARRTRGYWPSAIPANVNGETESILDTIGATVGGTSTFYAAALERPERHDFENQDGRPHPTNGWPVGYDAFKPHYHDAQGLYHVSGTPDPLSDDDTDSDFRPPPMLSPADQMLESTFSRFGLHPYRIPVGMKHIPGCLECAGRKCPYQCKMDAKLVGVAPALATGQAQLVNDFQVVRLKGTNNQITSVEGFLSGELHNVKGRIVVLAAGGLGSPALLLASASETWPKGCANQSGLVGRNLMFHLNDMVAIWPPRRAAMHGPAKTLSLRDFYFVDGQRYGAFQSLGLSASYGNIVQYLNERFECSALRHIRVLREFTRIPALAASRYFGAARIFSGIVEDLPYLDNRVLLAGTDQDSLKVQYRIHDELLQRWNGFRQIISTKLTGVRHYFITQAPSLNFGHPCGTVRFGKNPKDSVLDANCRSHDVDNLFVVDSAFMPTSTGVNPSLTIAANALRVAGAIVDQLEKGAPERSCGERVH